MLFLQNRIETVCQLPRFSLNRFLVLAPSLQRGSAGRHNLNAKTCVRCSVSGRQGCELSRKGHFPLPDFPARGHCYADSGGTQRDAQVG